MTQRVTLQPGERDTTPELSRMADEGRLPWQVANIMFGERVRTLGLVARLGRRWLALVPGIGPVNRRRLEALIADCGLTLAP